MSNRLSRARALEIASYAQAIYTDDKSTEWRKFRIALRGLNLCELQRVDLWLVDDYLEGDSNDHHGPTYQHLAIARIALKKADLLAPEIARVKTDNFEKILLTTKVVYFREWTFPVLVQQVRSMKSYSSNRLAEELLLKVFDETNHVLSHAKALLEHEKLRTTFEMPAVRFD